MGLACIRTPVVEVAVIRHVTTVLLLIVICVAGAGVLDVRAEEAPDQSLPRLYFPDRRQAIDGHLAGYWLEHGGASAFGYPVGTPKIDRNTLTQWFDYARLEYNLVTGSINRPALGVVHAEAAGYARWLKQFQPVAPDATEGRYFFQTRHSLAPKIRAFYETREMSSRLGAPISEPLTINGDQMQFFEYGAVSWNGDGAPQLARLGAMDARLHGVDIRHVERQPDDIAWGSAAMMTFADQMSGERWIEVDLSRTLAMAWVGDVMLAASPVVIGPPESPTPTGEFEIYIRHEVQDLSGIGWDGSPYYAPGTPWVMYFYQDFGFHGSTWRYKYGWAAGQGCVVSPAPFAEQIWRFADYGTRVVIHD